MLHHLIFAGFGVVARSTIRDVILKINPLFLRIVEMLVNVRTQWKCITGSGLQTDETRFSFVRVTSFVVDIQLPRVFDNVSTFLLGTVERLFQDIAEDVDVSSDVRVVIFFGVERICAERTDELCLFWDRVYDFVFVFLEVFQRNSIKLRIGSL